MVLSYTSEVTPEFITRIFWWREKLKQIHPTIANPVPFLWKDPWIRFILCWMIFDAYLTEISQCSNDGKKLEHFFQNRSDFKDHITTSDGLLLVYRPKLRILSPVLDMRPDWRKYGGEQQVYLRDETNLKQTFLFVYQIRCNLFHGGKNIRDDRDYQLVKEGGEFLSECIERWMRG